MPGKNLMKLGGQTLLQWAIESARAAQTLTGYLVTTDSGEIATHVPRDCGLVFRPAELASDTAGMVPTLQHALRQATAEYDLVVCLQPTSPFRTGEQIDECVAKITDEWDSAQTVTETPYDPRRVIAERDGRLLPVDPAAFFSDGRRQDAPKTYIPNGSVYVVRRHVLMEQGSLISLRHACVNHPRESSININDALDFLLAEALYANRRVG